MSEKNSSIKLKNTFANVLHIVFNLAVVVAALGLIWLFPQTPWPAIALVALSKYRVFMVKPRYWLPNILSGLVDFIFGVSIVVLMWVVHNPIATVGPIVYQVVLAVIYVAWLLWLKPNNKSWAVIFQAGLSQFIGLVAIFTVANYLWAPLVVLLAFFVGYACGRHMLMAHKESQYELLAIFWGLVVAQLSFLGYHWGVVYGVGLVQIPQIAVIVAIISFVVEKVYSSIRRNDGVVKQDEVLLPILAGSILIIILLMLLIIL